MTWSSLSVERRTALYALTTEQSERLRSGGSCDMCGRETRELYVDHDHSCCAGTRPCGQCTRGLLCKTCNTGLGRLEAALRYLRTSGSSGRLAARYLGLQ